MVDSQTIWVGTFEKENNAYLVNLIVLFIIKT